MKMLSPRQIHLDFHTSECIPGIAQDFDPEAFAQTMKSAHVTSATVFARGHHGWLYYDSKRFPDRVHPNLTNKNLLVQQVRALHAQGIKAPVYITVQWDYHSASAHPEWLVRKRDGAHEGGSFTEAGFYQSLCINTGYTDFLKEQTDEVMQLLDGELDGLFFDIVSVRPCLCAACRAEMKARGIDLTDDDAVYDFAKFSLDRFKRDMTAFVRARNADCTIFYNAGHVGPCTRESADAYTHFELESLPSGQWGYLHFPVTARYARMLGKDCMGMTGKFHTEWGDFHSLKNQAALEFECFRMLSMGFAASVGDQLEPCGRLNPATYELIGSVYSQLEQYEPYARPSRAVSEMAVLTAESARGELGIPQSLYGAVQLFEELSLQFDVLDDTMPLDGYRLVVLPEEFCSSPAFEKKLRAYVDKGGAVISFAGGGRSEQGDLPACFGAGLAGKNELYPDFLLAEGELAEGLAPGNEYVIYEQGVKLVPHGAKTLMSARAPYFARTGEHFCSHRYTPSAHGEAYPAVVQNGRCILFSHPMLLQYRQNAPLWVKRIVGSAVLRLLGRPLVRHNGPSTLRTSLLWQPEQNRYTLHLLSYIPVRKSAAIDLIEERTPACDVQVTLALGRTVKKVTLAPLGRELPVKDGTFTVPKVDGYAVLCIECE